MMTKFVFDPCAGLRKLIEILYERGLSAQAIQLTRRLDHEQLCQWQRQTCLSSRKSS